MKKYNNIEEYTKDVIEYANKFVNGKIPSMKVIVTCYKESVPINQTFNKTVIEAIEKENYI